MNSIFLVALFRIFMLGSSLSVSEMEPMTQAFTKAGTNYVISKTVDLRGRTVTIPRGCTLQFIESGVVKNGTLVGNNMKLVAGLEDSGIFNNVILKGSWSVEDIYSQWFLKGSRGNDTQLVKNVFSLCSEEQENHVYFANESYRIDGYDTEAKSPIIIRIPSRTYVHNAATFHILANASSQSFPFYFGGVTDCVWEGGRIVGDLDTHLEDRGEQGFGLALRGASNITIRDVECVNCWGDGINLQYGGGGKHNENIIIERVICDNNRRQGISIEDGRSISIRKSVFKNTGQKRGTSPKYGIDIEPYYDGAVISQILIEDCDFENNAGGGVACSFLKPTDSDVQIMNCRDLSGA